MRSMAFKASDFAFLLEASIALTLATGANIEELQRRVDAMEKKAIANEHFSAADKQFLHDLYAAMALGAKKTIVFQQSGRMMDRYLEGSGKPLELEPSIFSKKTRSPEMSTTATAMRQLFF